MEEHKCNLCRWNSKNSPEEDGAYCLMMLSRDKWSGSKEENSEVVVKEGGKTRRMKYRCGGSCRKVFRSYQALGGHRASHKKLLMIKATTSASRCLSGPTEVEENGNAEKIHECPFCNRVFSSGQALGGHKRSHFTSTSFISPSPKKLFNLGLNN
ncbi:unnamed protein product [Cuscuta europaea]|uniref:C2H2-type domain-containing protein n=1 Tax=Cuscuta europaea TaxID=41803 RepID=A0A9P1ECZ2_CUSEU|nr:unnamed protein product [Cuscuta europaea]